jgi:hypothetical protein
MGVALAGGFTLAPQTIELLTYDGEVRVSTRSDQLTGDMIEWKVSGADLSFDSGVVSQRTVTLDVVGGDPLLIPFPGGLLHPESGNRVRISAGIIGASGVEVSRPVATMLIDEATATEMQGVISIQLDLVDMLHPVRSQLEHSFDMAGGELVSSAVERLLAEVLPPGSYLVEDSGFSIPSFGTLSPGTDRMSTVTQLLTGCGQELVCSAEGLVYTREILSSDDDPNMERWVYGPSGVPWWKLERHFTSRTPQAWKIEGGSFTSGDSGQTIVVYDRDQRSEGFWRPAATNRQVGSTRLPWVGGTRQCAVAGYAQLRAHSSGPGVVTVEIPPNPLMVEGDLVELEADTLRASGLYRVRAFELPEGAKVMKTELRRVFDPALGYAFPLDRGEGCLLTASDDFERGAGPLDNPTAVAGLDWVTVDGGWRLDGTGDIEQAAPGRWAAAMLNTPMCSLDHSAGTTISSTALGASCGPLIRSSGELDGYTAQVDQAGHITLSVWLAGVQVATLGEAQLEGSPFNRDIALTAVGSVILVEVGGDVLITANDSRRTGSHVGLLGFNGDSGAPAISKFLASEAT